MSISRRTAICIMLLLLMIALGIDIAYVGVLQKNIRELRIKVAQQDLEIQRIQNEYDEYKENYRYISDVVNR